MLKEIIKNVSDFKIDKSTICTLDNESIFEKSLIVNGVRIEKKGIASFSIVDERIVFSTWEPNSYIYNTTEKTINMLVEGGNIKPETLTNESVIFSIKENDFYKNYKLHFVTNERIYVGNDIFGYLVNEFRVIYKGASIQVYNLINELIWQHELLKDNYLWSDNEQTKNNLGEFERIVGVHNNVLWITLNSGKLLGFYLETGEIMFDIYLPNNSPENLVFFGNYYWIGRYHQIDKNQGKLFGLRGNFYWEIDLANPTETYEVFDISETCKQNNIRADMPAYEWPTQGNEILFGEIFESPKNPGLNNVGIFDRGAKQIVWTERIGEEGDFLPVIQKLEMLNDKLYIQDGQNNLFIYERTTKL